MRKKLLRAIEKAYKLWVYKTHRASDHALINLGGDKADIYGVYTVMNVIPENDCIISAGLGTDTNFEEAVLKNYRNATVFAFDPTPKSINYVKEIKHLDQEKRFHFFPYGISKEDGREIFYLPSDNNTVSCSTIKNMYSSNNQIEVDMKSFRTVLELCHVNYIDILKLDIEGTEFSIIDDVLSSDIKIRQICLEVHPLFFSDPYRVMKRFMKKMFDANYKIAYITRNGWGDEITFIIGEKWRN